MPVNSKAKGNGYELKIAKKMTEWTGIKFERVPASGGLHWREDNRVYGDIVCNEADFPFVIECKNREAWNMDSLINGSKEVAKWWEQVTADAEATGKDPVVIFTRNRQPDYIMIRPESWGNEKVMLNGNGFMDLFLEVIVCGEKVQVFKLDDFIEKVDVIIEDFVIE